MHPAVLRCFGDIGGAGDKSMGLPRWLGVATLLSVGVLAAWSCWVQAQTGRGADGKIAGRGLLPRERLRFVLLLVPPAAGCLVAWLRVHAPGWESLQRSARRHRNVGADHDPAHTALSTKR